MAEQCFDIYDKLISLNVIWLTLIGVLIILVFRILIVQTQLQNLSIPANKSGKTVD